MSRVVLLLGLLLVAANVVVGQQGHTLLSVLGISPFRGGPGAEGTNKGGATGGPGAEASSKGPVPGALPPPGQTTVPIPVVGPVP